MRRITKVIVHCSASDRPEDDSIGAVKNLHTSKDIVNWNGQKLNGFGWRDVGYHFFISKNGTIEQGRPLSVAGAHTKGFNKDSIGICFSGLTDIPTTAQKLAWEILKSYLFKRYLLNETNIFPHNYFNKLKSCPNFPLSKLYS